MPAARALRKRRSLILAYHGVAESNAAVDPEFLRVSPGCVPRPGRRAAGARGSRSSRWRSSPRGRAAGGTPPPGLVALSFDDGMDDNHSVLLPILREYGAARDAST